MLSRSGIYASGLEYVNKLPLEGVALLSTSEAHRWMAISAVLEGAFQLLAARLSPVNRTRFGLNVRALQLLDRMNFMFPRLCGHPALDAPHVAHGQLDARTPLGADEAREAFGHQA